MRLNNQTNKKSAIFIVLFFTFFSLFLLFKPFGNGDELWNFNFGLNISNGLSPYKDFNMIQTPLAAYFMGFILKLFGKELIVYRVFGSILMTATFSLVCILCERITENMFLAIFSSCMIFSLNTIVWIYNYNNLNVLIIILVLYLEMKYEHNTENNGLFIRIAISTLVGMSPLIKQSTGFFIIIAFYFLEIIFSTKNKKHNILEIIYLIIPLLPSVIYVLLLLITNEFSSFVEYAVLGVKTFTHKKSVVSYIVSSPLSCILSIFIVITIMVSIIGVLKNKTIFKKKYHVKCLAYSIAGLSVIYPLCDDCHMLVAAIPFVVCMLCNIKHSIFSISGKVVCACLALAVVIYSSVSCIPTNIKDYKFCDLPHYQGVLIDNMTENNIIEIDKYIQLKNANGTKVLIADAFASAYMIPIEFYTKNYDMLLVGNIGLNTTFDLLEQIDGVVLVVRDDEKLNYQSHFDLIDEIKQRYQKVEEVGIFDAYQKQK